MVAVAPPRTRSHPAPASPGRSTASVRDEALPRENAAHVLTMIGLAMVGMTGLRAGSFTVSDFFFAAASGFVVFDLLSGSRRRLAPVRARRNSPALLLGLLVLSTGGLLATMLRSIEPASSALTLLRIWYITVVWFWTIRSVSTSLRSFQRLLLAAVAGAVFHAGVAIYQEVSGTNAGAPTWGRSTGYSDHFGDLGFSLASMLPLIAAWPAQTAGRKAEALRAVAVVVVLGGIGTSGSMTLLASAVIGVIVAMSLPRLMRVNRRARRRMLVPIAVAVLAVVTLSTGQIELKVFDRFGELLQSNSQTRWSANSRLDMNRVAIDGAVASPLVGVGLDEVSSAAANDFVGNSVANATDQNIHSIYLRLLFDGGVLALLGFLMILFVVGREGVQLARFVRRSTVAWLPCALLGCFAATCVGAAFAPIVYGRTVWLPAALISALGGLAKAGLLDAYKPTGATRSTRPASPRS